MLLISLMLSESTANLLQLENLCNVLEAGELRGSKCLVRSLKEEEVRTVARPRSFFAAFFTGARKEDDWFNSDTAYFSDTFTSNSNDSIISEDDEVQKEGELKQVLQPILVYTRPLLIVKSIMFENIYIKNNIIFVTFDEEIESDSEWICRICHGGSSLGDLFSPCKCKGSIALTHMGCLERWLKESSNSYCELCNHHFQIAREPRYSVPWSIVMYVIHPGDNLKDILFDGLSFAIYTPSAIGTTFVLMHICEVVGATEIHRTRNFSAHMLAFFAIFGMAAIDFTYSSWLIVTLQKHIGAWRIWYRNNSFLRLMLPEWKKKACKRKSIAVEDEDEVD